MASGRSREQGQSAVELLALLPVLVFLTVLVWQAVLFIVTWQHVAGAARAGARAAAVGAPPAEAAARVLGRRPASVEGSEPGARAVRVTARVPSVLPGVHDLGTVTARFEVMR